MEAGARNLDWKSRNLMVIATLFHGGFFIKDFTVGILVRDTNSYWAKILISGRCNSHRHLTLNDTCLLKVGCNAAQ